jgi:TrmH family RNA methyltransferase
MARISSPHNPLIKYVRSLERGRVRREEGVYLAEGVRLVGEALHTRQDAPIVLYDPEQLDRSASGSSLLAAIPTWATQPCEVDARVMRAATQTETPPGVLAVLRFPDCGPLAMCRARTFGLILDRLADPGNAGTILRTAAAAGVEYVITLPESVDLFAPKVVRAGMGAHFRVPLFGGVPWETIASTLTGVQLVVMDVAEGESVFQFRWPPRAALVVGSEAHGTSARARELAAGRVHIPMRPGVESLNASVAASITIYAALGPGIPTA